MGQRSALLALTKPDWFICTKSYFINPLKQNIYAATSRRAKIMVAGWKGNIVHHGKVVDSLGWQVGKVLGVGIIFSLTSTGLSLGESRL